MLLSQASTNTKFQKPTKNETGYYVSELEEPIVLTLPKMEIHGNGKNDKGQYEIRYILDINNNNFKELIENLYNLDEFALETAYQNSKEWFGQEISKDLEKKKEAADIKAHKDRIGLLTRENRQDAYINR